MSGQQAWEVRPIEQLRWQTGTARRRRPEIFSLNIGSFSSKHAAPIIALCAEWRWCYADLRSAPRSNHDLLDMVKLAMEKMISAGDHHHG
jgi:hypothetical protein